MAAAPLESSSTPPDTTSTDSTRPFGDSMEDSEPQSTRKRPRLDSGSGACESLIVSNDTSASRTPKHITDAPATLGEEASPSSRPASRVTINVKSPISDNMASAPSDSPTKQPTGGAGADAPTAISLSSSPAQSPEIEVADLEDMDQDPNTSSWKPLGEALRESATPEVVQLHDPLSLIDTFPKLRPGTESRESMEEISLALEKGSELDTTIFTAVKNWLDDVVNNLTQVTYAVFAEDRDAWEEVPNMVDGLLRRNHMLAPEQGEPLWTCLEEFFINYAQLAVHIIRLDTMLLRQTVKDPDVQPSELLSRAYLPSLGWILQLNPIPFFTAMEKSYGIEVPNLITRINDKLASPPIDIVKPLSEFAACLTSLVTQWPQFSQALLSVVTIAHNLVDSGNERRRHCIDEDLINSPVYSRTLKSVYPLIRALDDSYQFHITKKSPWVSGEISEQMLRCLSRTYLNFCHWSPEWSDQIAKDLAIEIPPDLPFEGRASIVHHGWKFAVLKKHIMDGRMELRVHGMETMQSDLVAFYRLHIQRDPGGINHPLVQYLVNFLRQNHIVEYIVGIDSHPQLISRSVNIIGFLVVTSTYTDADTDTIWQTVTESRDSRAVSEVLAMLSRTFHLHLCTSPALLYLCSKLLELPLVRFDARMIEFCDQLLYQVREKHNERYRQELSVHVDAIPLRLCVRLIRESAATNELSVDHKAHLQKFAATQLSAFMDIGLSESDKMETYELCVQDIADMNNFTAGSIQALNALLTNNDSQSVRKLAEEFDLTRLVVIELAKTVNDNQIDFADTFSWNGFLSRIQLLARIIDGVPEYITADLSDILWRKVFISKLLVQQGRRALWDKLCALTRCSTRANPFIERCLTEYLPKLSPNEDYSPEVLFFAKHAINYEIRFHPPPIAGENEVVVIPGMDRIWNMILTAPPGTIETDATSFAIEVYLDHSVINRSPRSAVEATHIALVDRCVDQLKTAASNLHPSNAACDGSTEAMTTVASESKVHPEELRFSRSLLVLRQFLQGLRSRPQYSPPQNSTSLDLPASPVNGELINIRYQAFNGGTQTKVNSLQIGDLSTAAELVDTLVRVTGFTKLNTIFGGQRIDLLEKPNTTLRDLKLRTGLLIVRRDPESREVALPGRRQSLTSVDSEVLKHFDDLYDLLGIEEHLAREIYDFLIVFPPQERVVQLVKSTESTEDDMFPMDKPYNFLYSVHALSVCLREEALESSPNQDFVSHSIKVLVSALIRPAMSVAFEESATKLMFATHLIECLLYALLVRPARTADAPLISDAPALSKKLLECIDIARKQPPQISEPSLFKLICHSFAILTEGSVRDFNFWSAVKQCTQFDTLLVSLLLDEYRQPIRKGIAENIAVVCSPSMLLKKQAKPARTELAESSDTSDFENPVRLDILATIWDAFTKIFPRTLDHASRSHEFFEVAYLIFRSVAEKSPQDLVFSQYLKQWSQIMLLHKTEEFVGRELIDDLILGFCRLLKACLDLANNTETAIDTFNLAEELFDKYLFPDLSMPSDDRIVPQIPVMHTQTRQELYSILGQLCEIDHNYAKLVNRVLDVIPQDYTYSASWCFDRFKLIRSPEGYAGLKNLSNTCYLNSLLTQLFMNVDFRDFMMRLELEDPDTSQNLLDETRKLFAYMQETWQKSVDSQAFVDTIRTYDNEAIDVTVQMDVDEFYNLLFDRWEAQIPRPEDKKKFRSFYGGQLVQQIKSKECPHISERLEPFSAIQCEIKGKESLEESLQAYVEGEIMQGDNKYSCTSCGRHVDAVKRACLKDVPDNLIFHLKRFDFDMFTMMRSKINDEFKFPECIDMSPYNVEYLADQSTPIQEDMFELVGVLVHSGTAESGHYYSFIRERPTADTRGSWVEFNDSDVSHFDHGKIPDQCFGGVNDSLGSSSMGQVRFNKAWNAYMLFYQRVSSMESARNAYKPTRPHHPVQVHVPTPLANHIVMENELFVRTYCLLDPCHSLFVRFMLSLLQDSKDPACEERLKLDRHVITIALDTFEQLLSRTRELSHLDTFVAEILRVIDEVPRAAYRVMQWLTDHPSAVRNLLLKSPHVAVRNSWVRIIICALAKLQELHRKADNSSKEQERWLNRYLDAFESLVNTLDDLWAMLHTVCRSWDDYFELLLLLVGFGGDEAGLVLNSGFLQKCLELVWLDHEDLKRLRRQYVAYWKLLEKGRRFSHRKMTDLLAALLAHVNLAAPPSADDRRRILSDGRYSLTAVESGLIWSTGMKQELLVLQKILQQYSSPQACKRIVGLFVDAEPDAGLLNPICKTLEEGLRLSPAENCIPYLEATLIFCRQGPDKDRIAGLIEFVAKGIETIGNSGGQEHLNFFTGVMASKNERIGLNEAWFLTQLIDKIPDWAPTLLIYPERAVRTMTLEVLRQILFSGQEEIDENWEPRQREVAKELVHVSVERLRKLCYNPSNTGVVDTKVLECIRTVIDHCLTTYFDASDEDQEVVLQTHEFLATMEEFIADLPEEVASEEWEDNSVMASDSEMGPVASP
ncbi:putative ubiquitin C-terminal hydrolase [Aspergillus homomorphus CBS 101889]|uniref:Ubiquitin C-terminal hydrolase n=1 Tax=Aspergillus homomorphus (strain CBS 101889) TaxID=1450537 RepID=A0A395I4T9_ASPHC|nr:ubiquitin C-terminal hydrolase [Aspergillus homomorphus CBS 101889]RAL15100.1 ubiquitin C-terminal hydrolase [Aspergillus homomorphus CBS 101889]